MTRGQRVRLQALQGDDLRNAFAIATGCLERSKDAINALNVFPVPDGDTGTNMLLTMKAANEAAALAPEPAISGVAAALAQGSLMGARGNSGVILSQFFSGLARALEGKESCGPGELVASFQRASEAAYRAVSRPVEGTMLTVIRELAQAAGERTAWDGEEDCLDVWEAALQAAREAVARTPSQLLVLREAGVVDAGGQGLVVLLEGAFRSLKGEPVEGWEMELIVPVGTVQRPLASVREEYLAATEEELYGYCAQFLIQGQDLDQDAIRARLDGLAQSTVVVGNESMVKVHVHVADPEPLMDYARSLGELSQVSIDNIDEQHQEFIAGHRQRRVMAVAVVAVGWGQGFVRLFRDLGAAAVVVCQETMNPSIQELLAAVEATAAQRVIVLPNNDNAVPAASQMASLASRPVHVIPTGTLPQGVAALLAFNPEEGLEANLKTMEQAVSGVRTLEVTRAVRPVSIGGVEVGEGQTIALLEGTLAAAGDSLPEVVQDALTRVGPGKGSLVTLYYGAGVSQEEAGQLAAYLRQNLPQVEVETVHGDQPHYSYLISIE